MRIAFNKLSGRKVGGRCVVDKKSLRHKPASTRQVAAGWLLRRSVKAGKRTVTFSGRIGRRALNPGRTRTISCTILAG